ncbi:MAG: hypothetical protein HN576_16230 [Bacteriovoracaceae bacterium]|jgi:RNA recognition motif-containing protein|nr:hypothetical protein [Bacteriovoracaceae bacterium]
MKAAKLNTISERTIGVFQKGKNVTTIYIGNLRFNKSESDIKKLFTKFGNVNFVRLMLDTKTNQSKGFAFIQMPNRQEALNAIKSLDGKQLDGRTLKASVAKESGASKVPYNPNSKKDNPKNKSQNNEEKSFRQKKKSKGLNILFNHLNSI